MFRHRWGDRSTYLHTPTISTLAMYKVVVTARNDAGTSAPALGPTGPFAPGYVAAVDLTNTVAPSVSGSETVGQALSSTLGTWLGMLIPVQGSFGGDAIRVQWERCVSASAGCTEIAGALSAFVPGQIFQNALASYNVQEGEAGYWIRTRATAFRGGSICAACANLTVWSVAQGPVAPLSTPPPPSSGGGGGGGSNDLNVTGIVSPLSSPVGGSNVWRLRVKNSGGGIAFGVVLDVQLSGNATYGFSQVTRGSGCVPTGAVGAFRCNLDLLGASIDDSSYADVVIGTNVASAGEVTLNATASFAEIDPTPADNTLTLKANTPVTIAPGLPPVRTPAAQKGVARSGNAKANTLVGTAFADVLRGLGGNDTLRGNGGADKLFGGAGNDTINGGAGADLIDGGAGNDRITARDGQRDTVHCGTGTDTVTADKTDTISRDCETVTRR